MKRPVGITILALLYAVGGAALLALQLAFADRLSAVFEEIGSAAIVSQLAVLVLGVLGLAGGIGMWLGKSWGWWVGAFYLTYSVARNLSALVSLPGIYEQSGPPAGGATIEYLKLGARIVVHSLVCWYFFTPKVEAYFSVATVSQNRRIAGLLVATVLLVLFFAGLQMYVQRPSV